MPITNLPPLALYVHLPWCVHKCPYCDFNSFELRGALADAGYVDALLRDLDFELPLVARREIVSIFIGGGTPSLFGGPAIARLLDGVRARLRVPSGCEITLEANPGAVEAQRFAAYRAAGVNRLSIGAQSFRSTQLEALGRVHGVNEIGDAVALARAAGFDNLNLDLMYGLPEETLAGALADLEHALAFEPEHLSWYQLTLEPNTAFHRRPPPLPDDELVTQIESAGRELLARRGYTRYEVSAYAQPGRRCRHNLNYWQFGDYVGLGAGAHGKLTRADGTIERRSRLHNPRSYQAGAGRGECVRVDRIERVEDLRLEFLMNALRLTEGVPRTLFAERTGLTLDPAQGALSAAIEQGWLDGEPDTL
ncbi:MAG TPA: radical SAM family heme chaperone HemW, partial [Gammaproteobacteria bacterium]|nr:radical SAM family heme chaperone HemW [Gammaproteobacteria bacterium]